MRTAILAFFVIGLAVMIGGFFVYVAEYKRAAVPSFETVDGIVVLTGGPDRLTEGVALMAAKRAPRLLISGLNPQTRPEDLVQLVPSLKPFMACCVTLDYKATNTRDNGIETVSWAQQFGVRSVLVVTSHAHLPRAMFELVHRAPDIVFFPHRVGGPPDPDDWWRDPLQIRVMLIEYVKLSAVIVRYSGELALERFDRVMCRYHVTCLQSQL